MEFNQVEAFVAVAQTGGFSRAAIQLHLSQPAISRRITLLEQEIGAVLFNRLHNVTSLTEAGQALLPHAQRVLAEMRDAIAAVQEIEAKVQGVITLAIVGTLAGTPLTQRLKRFRANYPAVKLRLQTARSREISDLVRSGEAHLGLRYFADPDPKLFSQVADYEQLVVVCSAQSSLGASDYASAQTLQNISWVSFPLGQGSSGEPFARLHMEMFHTLGTDEPKLIFIDSLTAQKRLIEADFGLGLLPISSIQEELALGTLRVLEIPELNASVPIVVLHRADGYLSKAAQSLLNDLLNVTD